MSALGYFDRLLILTPGIDYCNANVSNLLKEVFLSVIGISVSLPELLEELLRRSCELRIRRKQSEKLSCSLQAAGTFR